MECHRFFRTFAGEMVYSLQFIVYETIDDWCPDGIDSFDGDGSTEVQ